VEVDIAQISPAVSYPLRQAALRPHQKIEEVATPEDDDPDSATFGATDRDTGVLVGTATVLREARPWQSDGAVYFSELTKPQDWRLRYMATREDLRGQGLGSLVLEAALAHVAVEAAEEGRSIVLVWCNARVGAIAFYERAGFRTRGDEWITPFSGPHVVMWRTLETGKMT
jgi:GNAT superfamily N-acetyltransferase